MTQFTENPQGGTPPAPVPPAEFGDRQPCLMLVDDDPVVTEVLRVYLQDAGYRELVTISDSTVAAEMARAGQPDLMLLDLMMPKMSGFEVLAALRGERATRHLPVIMLTSATDPENKLRALELGATDLLAKPVDPSELVLRVRNSLAAKAYQDRLAYSDHVTGLPNRGRFLEELDGVLSRARPGGTRNCAVLQVGMDRFKQINDALGYSAGDRVLKELGARIRVYLNGTDGGAPATACTSVARTGGDEFAVLLPHAVSRDEVAQLAAGLRACMAEPMTHFGDSLYVTASVGAALAPEHGQDVDTLLAHAGQALSYAKRRGGDGVEVYSDEIDSWARERLELERDLRAAAAGNALHLEYQPKVDVATGRVLGAEALLRWKHPVRGPVGPGEFIPLAEETGLIVPIGAWVLREACREAGAWHRRGLGDLRVAVNVSARQFQHSNLDQVVACALEQGGLPPRCLTVEVTESLLMEDPEEAARTLNALKDLGVQISVDDFGTGYSSLAYLKRFNVDELKVDRSFVREIPGDEDDAAIVTAVLAMARSLGLKVVAEGVETPAQLAFLTRLGCDQFQGFLFSRAVPSAEFTALVTAPPAVAARAAELRVAT